MNTKKHYYVSHRKNAFFPRIDSLYMCFLMTFSYMFIIHFDYTPLPSSSLPLPLSFFLSPLLLLYWFHFFLFKMTSWISFRLSPGAWMKDCFLEWYLHDWRKCPSFLHKPLCKNPQREVVSCGLSLPVLGFFIFFFFLIFRFLFPSWNKKHC